MPFPRQLTPELMDDPAIDAARHIRALHGLARLNRVSQSARTVYSGVRSLTDRQDVRILDIATGSGDNVLGLARLTKRSGQRVRLSACDISPRALDLARSQSRLASETIEFFAMDALGNEPLPETDIATCSLFCHHLTSDELTNLLRAMVRSARLGIVVSDLRRTRHGIALALIASRTLTRSDVVHTDAVRSARAAWTIEEFREHMLAAGLRGASIEKRWPSRLLAVWRREDGAPAHD